MTSNQDPGTGAESGQTDGDQVMAETSAPTEQAATDVETMSFLSDLDELLTDLLHGPSEPPPGQQMATPPPLAAVSSPPTTGGSSRQTIVLATATLVTLAWSLIFWLAADSTGVAIAALISANFIGCCLLLPKRRRP